MERHGRVDSAALRSSGTGCLQWGSSWCFSVSSSGLCPIAASSLCYYCIAGVLAPHAHHCFSTAHGQWKFGFCLQRMNDISLWLCKQEMWCKIKLFSCYRFWIPENQDSAQTESPDEQDRIQFQGSHCELLSGAGVLWSQGWHMGSCCGPPRTAHHWDGCSRWVSYGRPTQECLRNLCALLQNCFEFVIKASQLPDILDFGYHSVF
jgi:hypothetical protein